MARKMVRVLAATCVLALLPLASCEEYGGDEGIGSVTSAATSSERPSPGRRGLQGKATDVADFG